MLGNHWIDIGGGQARWVAKRFSLNYRSLSDFLLFPAFDIIYWSQLKLCRTTHESSDEKRKSKQLWKWKCTPKCCWLHNQTLLVYIWWHPLNNYIRSRFTSILKDSQTIRCRFMFLLLFVVVVDDDVRMNRAMKKDIKCQPIDTECTVICAKQSKSVK